MGFEFSKFVDVNPTLEEFDSFLTDDYDDHIIEKRLMKDTELRRLVGSLSLSYNIKEKIFTEDHNIKYLTDVDGLISYVTENYPKENPKKYIIYSGSKI